VLRYAKNDQMTTLEVWHLSLLEIFISTLLLGDPLYTPISASTNQTEQEIMKRLGRLAWKTVNTVVNLTEQERMKTDHEFGSAVQRL